MTTCPQCGRRAQPGDSSPVAPGRPAPPARGEARFGPGRSRPGWTPIWFLPRSTPTPDAHGLLRA